MTATLFPIRRGKRSASISAIEQQMQRAGLPDPDTEFQFAKHIGRRWRFDMAFVDWLVAVEVEGGAFGRVVLGADGKRYRLGGRHNTGSGLEKDAEKYNEAQIQGWIVIRVTPRQIRDGEAIQPIQRALTARGWTTTVVPCVSNG